MAKRAPFTSPDLVAGQPAVAAKPPTNPGVSLGGAPRTVKTNIPKAGAFVPKGQAITISHLEQGLHISHGHMPTPKVDTSIDTPSAAPDETVSETIGALHKKFRKGAN